MLADEALVPFSKMTDGISWDHAKFPEFRWIVSASTFVNEIPGCHLNNNAALISGKVNRWNDIHIKQYDSSPKQLSPTIFISYLLYAKYLSFVEILPNEMICKITATCHNARRPNLQVQSLGSLNPLITPFVGSKQNSIKCVISQYSSIVSLWWFVCKKSIMWYIPCTSNNGNSGDQQTQGNHTFIVVSFSRSKGKSSTKHCQNSVIMI